MEFLQLRYFLESARTGSFSKAAEKYMVPTSSVSASIRRLEQELGQKLFSRSANRITLNENGRQLQKTVAAVLGELDQTVNDITNPPDKQVIRLLVLSGRHRITDFIIEYRKKHPSIIFDACINYETENIEDYDIIVSMPLPHLETYSSFVLYNCRILLQVADNHHLCNKVLTMAQLRDQPFATMGGSLHSIIVAACQKAGFTPNVIAKVNDIDCYRKLIRSGDVIGYRRDFGNGPLPGLAHLNVVDFLEHQQICVFYKPSAAVGNIKHFLEFLKAKAQ